MAHAADQALERGDAREQHLVRHQPGDRPVEQQPQAVVPGPAEHVEPAGQPKAGRGVLLQSAEPVALADQGDVAPALPAVAVGVEARRRGFAELPRGGGDHRGRRLGRVVEEGAEEAGRAELGREPDPVVGAAHPADQVAVGGVEVEVAGELLLAGGAGVAAVARALVVGEEAARHGVRNSGLLRRSGVGPGISRLLPAKVLCERPAFCDKFRTLAEAGS